MVSVINERTSDTRLGTVILDFHGKLLTGYMFRRRQTVYRDVPARDGVGDMWCCFHSASLRVHTCEGHPFTLAG